MTLQGAIEWIQDQALTLSGVGYAPDNPTDQNPTNIWVMAYPESGEIISAAAGWGYDLNNIAVRIYTGRGDLGESMYRLEGYPHNLARLIQADPTLGGNAATYGDMSYRWFADTWGSVPVIGYQLNVNNVKILTTY
jgi:hypothetical protein